MSETDLSKVQIFDIPGMEPEAHSWVINHIRKLCWIKRRSSV